MKSGTPRFSIVLGQRASWTDLLDRVRETEDLGFDGLYLVDHFFGLKDVDDPTHDAYTMLAALAPFTQRMRLGIMVCGNTYRNPALLLKQAMTVDHVSGGRVDFGVGAGWLEREHEAYGFPFPSARERVDRFAEALDIWDMLQSQERTTYEGQYYRLLDAPFEPKSLQSPRMPVLIGASGPRMLRLVARHADIWNTVGTPAEAGAANVRLDAACIETGRDPASLVRAVSPSINLLESVEAFSEGVAAYHAAGFSDICMPWPRTPDQVPVLREVARDIIPGFRGHPVIAGNSTSTSLRGVGPGDADLVSSIYAGLADGDAKRVIDVLIDSPGERFDGVALVEHLGLADHGAATLAVAALGEAFAELGLARPWNEAQRGYQLLPETAAVLSAARTQSARTQSARTQSARTQSEGN